ncbi:metal-dependent hydrolase [Alloalcanivorax profundimaris]|uniref:metal-dependent hydrolase n=1 Tax=Alloalcanivorax profundimaris TaxID=2735259 RepID=UPI000C4137E0|nr:metal-dependent hydrolase [Alloalcanivorax profundimaris]MAO58448.1 metal-dependent hydrolase [Alcanivorax sp.]MCQ6260442.1 metal-dependent hydrolase [Alcanivorax sp. MM125-6]MAY10281.1 metal-dependent hydrolase [Alcanivorax sp.]MBF1803194.1 metal-dependent hydrolase [Alloalcanivorax profundimaris]MBI53699.1 metal-dependent hydrolase [Alcanivorax sp.]|tara:strand:- start:156585 stop:157427 length:843 start_codon:yes stop_codon:yes gene_type:complete
MAINILPTRRNLRFKLDASKALSWHRDGRNVSQFLNTLSLFFPVGERFFIDSVRHYRDLVQDPDLKAAVTAFIGQEAMHGREHEEYNQYVNDAGVPVEAQEKLVAALLARIQKSTPKAFQLSGTVALEHLTAILADGLLSLPEILDGADEGYQALWNWHALEETEHKAVAFDVYQLAVGTDDQASAYALRCFALVLSTSVFFALFLPFYLHNVRVSGGLFDRQGWRAVWRHSLGRKGIFRYTAKAWLDWFKPGFHPWDHDNRQFLEQFDELVAHALKDAA